MERAELATDFAAKTKPLDQLFIRQIQLGMGYAVAVEPQRQKALMFIKHGGQGGRVQNAVCPQLQLLGGGGLQALGGVWV